MDNSRNARGGNFSDLSHPAAFRVSLGRRRRRRRRPRPSLVLVQTFSGAARRRPRRQKREAEVEVDRADQPTARVGAGGALPSDSGGGGGSTSRLPNSGIGLSAGGLQVRKWKKFWATLSRTDTKDGISGAAKKSLLYQKGYYV